MQREDLIRKKPSNPVKPSKPKITAAPSLFKAPESKKQPRVPSNENSDDEESSDYEHYVVPAPGVVGANGNQDIDDGEADTGELQVNFELQDPKEEDYHAIKQFLMNYLQGAKFNSAELSDLILKEPIGSVIRIDGEDSYGFISIISLHSHTDLECVKQIKKWLLGKVREKDAAAGATLQALFEDTGRPLGLLLNERMVNVPLELAHPLHRTAFEEVEIAADDDKAKWGFENILLLSSFYQESKSEQKGPLKKKKRREWSDEILYHKPEEECYAKVATLSCSFPMNTNNHEGAARWTLVNFVKDTAQLLLIPREQIPRVLADMEALTG